MDVTTRCKCPECKVPLLTPREVFRRVPLSWKLVPLTKVAGIFLVVVLALCVGIVWVAHSTFGITGSLALSGIAVAAFVFFAWRQMRNAIDSMPERLVCIQCKRTFSAREMHMRRLSGGNNAA